MSGRTRTVLRLVRRLALLACLVALLVGLGGRPAPRPKQRPQLDVVIAVDRTTSMAAVDDPAGSRIMAARRDLLTLLGHLEGARVAVVTFGRVARLDLPFTSDLTAAQDAVQRVQTELPTVGVGSRLDRPVPLLLQELHQSAASVGPHVTAVVVVSDGEVTTPSSLAAFAPVGQEAKASVVLGYGTREGGVMPIRRLEVDGRNARQVAAGPLVPDAATGAPAVTVLDPRNLYRIADELDGTYVAADGHQDMAQVAADLQSAAYADLPPTVPQRELRWLWALLLLLLTIPELLLGWRHYLEARREGRG